MGIKGLTEVDPTYAQLQVDAIDQELKALDERKKRLGERRKEYAAHNPKRTAAKD